jgi:SAM-dependent methyltransferase
LKSLKHSIKRSLSALTNNLILNNVMIFLKKDNYFSAKGNPYTTFVPADKKSVQENAGYSNRQEINEVLERSRKVLLEVTATYLKAGDKILDIGCGPGMYLSLFKDSGFELHATDINAGMIAAARQQVPNAVFYQGELSTLAIPEKFKMIYCIGVLIYIPPTKLKPFIKKIHSLLHDHGVLYLNFPHAISYWDTWFKDITYVQYSPAYLRELLSPYFEIEVDGHAFDERFIDSYDKTPYKSLNPDTDRTYKNSYLLVAKKKL